MTNQVCAGCTCGRRAAVDGTAKAAPAAVSRRGLTRVALAQYGLPLAGLLLAALALEHGGAPDWLVAVGALISAGTLFAATSPSRLERWLDAAETTDGSDPRAL